MSDFIKIPKDADSEKILRILFSQSKNTVVKVEALRHIKGQDFLKTIAKIEKGTFGKIAVEGIDNEEFLKEIALSSTDWTVGADAVLKIKNQIDGQKILGEIALSSRNHDIRVVAMSRINNERVSEIIALKARNPYVMKEAVKKIKDSKFLKKLLLKTEGELKTAIIDGITYLDTGYIGVLTEIALSGEENISTKISAVKKIVGGPALRDVVESSQEHYVKLVAISQIEDLEILRWIVENKDENSYIRSAAYDKISEIEEEENKGLS